MVWSDKFRSPPAGLAANLSESSGWKTVSSSATANTNGAIVELIASTSFASVWLSLHMLHTGGTSSPQAKFDIMVGAATSEVEKIVDEGIKRQFVSNVGFEHGVSSGWPFVFPSGSRLSIRIEDDLAISLAYLCLVSIFKKN